jgi:hypothetical protein
MNFVNLYNKIKYFKKINDKAKGGAKKPKGKDDKGGKGSGSKSDSTSTKTNRTNQVCRVRHNSRRVN